MKIESDRIFLDTNVLVYSTFEDYDKAKHLKCTKAIADLTASGKFLCISPQVLREFFAVSTNKNIFKKPLPCNRQQEQRVICNSCLLYNGIRFNKGGVEIEKL